MIKIGVIAGSTRPGRRALDVANWVLDVAGMRGDAVFELVDIQAYNLPLLDEPAPPSMGQYTQAHTKVWSAKIAEFDGLRRRRVLPPLASLPVGEHGCRPPEVRPSPPPIGWSTGFIATPRTCGRRPSQRLRPALPSRMFM